MLYFLLICFGFYAFTKGIDFFFLIAASCVLYFYPLIFFDKIFFIANDSINSAFVNEEARISVVIGIVFLLTYGFTFRVERQHGGPPRSTAEASAHRSLGNLLAFALVVVMGLLVVQNGFGLAGREKADLMQNLGYLYKLFLVLTALVVGAVFIVGGRFILAAALAAVALDLMYGFRGGMAELIGAYFLTRRPQPGWKNLAYLIFGSAAVALMIYAKESAYFTRDLSDVLEGVFDSHGEDDLAFLSMANPESASISYLYNEVVGRAFSIPVSYLGDAIVSIFPFTGIIGFEASGFDTYFKGVLIGDEGESFASGMLTVGFSLFGFWGVAIVFYWIARLGRFFARANLFGGIVSRLLGVAVATIMLTTVYRSDVVYLIGIIRSLLVIVVLFHVFRSLLHQLSQSHASERAASLMNATANDSSGKAGAG